MRAFLILLALMLSSVPAAAQTEEEDKGRFLEFIENRLSTDNRIIRVAGIEGALSSQASIDLITVADREGVWLRLEGNVIDWSRRALLRGRLDIERLSAERIEVLRTPVPDPDAVPDLQAGGFAIPDLPLSIEIDELAVGELFLGEPLLGTEALFSISGSIALVDGGLTAALSAARLDEPGGDLIVSVAYTPGEETVAVRLELDEPAGGLVASLANLEGEPPVTLLIEGQGTLDDLTVTIGLDAGDQSLLDGEVRLEGAPEGRRILADLDGAFAPLLPASLRDFVGLSSTLDLVALQREEGGFTVDRLALESGEISLQGQLRTAADGFLELLDLQAAITPRSGVAELPGGTRIGGANVDVDYNTGGAGRWNALAAVTTLDAGAVGANEVSLRANGLIENPNDPAARTVSFAIDGEAAGLSAQDRALAQALGDTLRLDVSGAYRTDQPVEIGSATLTLSTLRAVLSGVVDGLTFRGDADLSIASLEPFSALAGRDLAGAAQIGANGSVAAVGGAFDLTLDGTTTNIETGIAAADDLLGDAMLSGRIARDETGITAENFRLDGEGLDLTANGAITPEQADFQAMLDVADLSALSERVDGAATINARVQGMDGEFTLSVNGAIPSGSLADRALNDATFGFDGTLDDGDLRGTARARASLDGEPVALDGDLATLGDIRQLTDLVFRAGEAELVGSVRQNANGTFSGDLALDASSIETIAALATLDGEGAANADITLLDASGEQSIKIAADLRGVNVAGTEIARADVVATVTDAFGVPVIDGRASAQDVVAGGVTVNRLDATASGTAEATSFQADATLNETAELEIAGSLSSVEIEGPAQADGGAEAEPAEGLDVTLTTLRLEDEGAAVRLARPATLRVAGGAVSLNDLVAEIGGGTLRASGTAGEVLDLELDLERVGLDVANAVRPDLALSGTLSGNARVQGTATAPDASFTLSGNALTAAPLREGGIDPLAVEAQGTFTDNTLRVPNLLVSNASGVRIEGNASAELGAGTAGALSANVSLSDLPLSVANGFRDGLDASGTASGIASVSGTVGSPTATFMLDVADATAAPLRDAGVEPLGLGASGAFQGDRITVSTLELTNPQGVRASATGTVPLGEGMLDLEVDLAQLPLSIGGVALPDLGLQGTVQGTLDLEGTLQAPQGAFDLQAADVSLEATRAAGIAPLAADLEGSVTPDGVRLQTARVSNSQGIAVDASGTVPLTSDGAIDVQVVLDALPLALIDAVRPELGASGTVEGRATVQGTLADPRATFDVTLGNATAKPLRDAGLAPIDASANGRFADQTLTLQALNATDNAGLSITAEGTVPVTGEGEIDLTANVSGLPLSMADAVQPELGLRGEVNASVDVGGTIQAPTGRFEIAASGVSAAPLRENFVEPLSVNASGTLEGDAVRLTSARVTNAQGIDATASGRVPFSTDGTLDVEVSLDDVPLSIANAARPSLGLQGRVSGTASVEGTIAAPEGTFDLSGRGVSARQLSDAGVAPLDLDVSGSSNGQSVELASARVSNGQGVSIAASGRVPFAPDGALDVDVTVDDVPLSVANSVAPDLRLGGRVSGSASVTGSLNAPRGTFDVSGRGVTAAPLRENGVAPLDLDVAGSSDGQRVRLTAARVRNGQGVAVSATGTLPTNASGPLDVDVRLDSLPLSLANAVRPDLRAGGTVRGTASVNGPIRDPRVSFDLDGSGITAAPLADNGIDPLTATASGTFSNGAVRLSSSRVSNGQGIDVSASGTVPVDGGRLGVQVDAEAPLNLANRFLADRGAVLNGQARFSGSVQGRLSNPRVNGMVSTQNASFTDPLSNTRLEGLDLMASIDNDRVTFRSATASLAAGGTVTLSGGINLDGLVADLLIILDGARYADGRLVVATVDGRLRVSGPLNASPLIAGRIDVRRADITVPDSLAGTAEVLDVVHVHPPTDVARTLARARVFGDGADGTPVPRTRPQVPNLDILVSAPNQIFIRGRGLDAEVGGEVRVRGPVTSVRPTGAFDLIRGRLSILTQRITFERGTVTLVGDLDPVIDFRATTTSGDVLVIISVEGRASDLSITFSSEPDLPQDEVLARLIFDRGLDELSPLQIARLAAAAAELAGNGPSIFSGLRDATGLDDLDVTTDAEGNAAVRAGRYINDNIYLGVEAGAGGGRVTVDLDITDDLKARATSGPDESTLGIFFEKDF